jgi:DNA-binding NarL/FixJ family response regulator
VHSILIIDNDSECVRTLGRAFAALDCFELCAPAETELTAIEEARRHSPNLIVLGLPLPEAGLTLLVRELKKAAPNGLIFLLTNNYDSVVEKRALSMGITAVFSKFDDYEALLRNARGLFETDCA